MRFARLADGRIVPVIVIKSNGEVTKMNRLSMNFPVGREAFLELARMTQNRKLRMVYARAYAKHVKKQKALAATSA